MQMIKLIGSILVTAGTVSGGVNAVKGLSEHTKVLESMLNAVELMRSEIIEKLTPMPELMKLAEESSTGKIKELFRKCAESLEQLGNITFPMLWRKNVEECLGSILKGDELQLISELGASLGRYDSETQCRAIDYTLRRLEVFRTRAERERAKQGKVYGMMSVAIGVLAIIILA